MGNNSSSADKHQSSEGAAAAQTRARRDTTVQRKDGAAKGRDDLRYAGVSPFPIRERLVLFFERYDRSVVRGAIEAQAAKHEKDTDAYFRGLVAQFGPEPPITVGEARAAWRARIRRVLVHYNAAQHHNLDELMETFLNRESELFDRVVARYGNEPQSGLSAMQRLAIEVFSTFDADSSGALDSHELPDYLRALGYTLSNSDAQVLIRRYDLNGDGALSRIEIMAMIDELPVSGSVLGPPQSPRTRASSLAAGVAPPQAAAAVPAAAPTTRVLHADPNSAAAAAGSPPQQRQRASTTAATPAAMGNDAEIRRVFNAFDRDRSGTISLNELIAGLTSAGEPLSHEQVRKMFATELEYGGNNTTNLELSFTQFANVIRRLQAQTSLKAVKQAPGAVAEATFSSKFCLKCPLGVPATDTLLPCKCKCLCKRCAMESVFKKLPCPHCSNVTVKISYDR